MNFANVKAQYRFSGLQAKLCCDRRHHQGQVRTEAQSYGVQISDPGENVSISTSKSMFVSLFLSVSRS